MTREGQPSVVFFLPSLGGGGAEKVLLVVAGGLADRGWKVTVATPRPSGEWRDVVPAGCTLETLPGGRMRAAIPALRAMLRRNGPDAALASPEPASLALLAAAAGRSRWPGHGPRLVVREATSVVERVRGIPLAERLLRDQLTRFAYRRADLVLAVSEGVRDEVVVRCGLRPDRVRVIPNPAVPSIGSGRESTGREVVDHGDGPKAPEPSFPAGPFVLAVGRLGAEKGFDLLLDAFAASAAVRTHTLVILGEGPARAALEAQVRRLGLEGRVILPGFEPAVAAYLDRCDLFILSSRYEGMPNALLEAMRAGCRIVATSCPHGPEEVLDAYPFEHELVEPGGALALAAAIDRVLGRPPRPGVPYELPPELSVDRVVDAYAEALVPGRGVASPKRSRLPRSRRLPEGSAAALPLPTAAQGVVLVGRRPPPPGGVSVFVDRLAQHWSGRADIPVEVIAPAALPRLAWRMLFRRGEEYHLHTTHPGLLAVTAMTGALGRSWIHDHNRTRGVRAGSPTALVLRYVMNRAMGVRAVSPEVRNRLHALGVRRERISLFVPFLPPPSDETPRGASIRPTLLRAGLPAEFAARCSEWLEDPGVRIVAWSAWALVEDNGADLYGALHVAEAAARIAALRSDVRFLFLVGDASRGGAFAERARSALARAPGAMLLTGGVPLWDLLPKVDLYLRTTTTDGDSVSVREALHQGVAVVASDSASRPAGVETYPTGEVDTLVEAIVRVLSRAEAAFEARGRSG